jgi:hypothetical protein
LVVWLFGCLVVWLVRRCDCCAMSINDIDGCVQCLYATRLPLLMWI